MNLNNEKNFSDVDDNKKNPTPIKVGTKVENDQTFKKMTSYSHVIYFFLFSFVIFSLGKHEYSKN